MKVGKKKIELLGSGPRPARTGSRRVGSTSISRIQPPPSHISRGTRGTESGSRTFVPLSVCSLSLPRHPGHGRQLVNAPAEAETAAPAFLQSSPDPCCVLRELQTVCAS